MPPRRRLREAEKTLADLPVELLSTVLSYVQSDCNDRTPISFALACKATNSAWKQRFKYLKAGEAEGRALISWLASKYPKKAARVLLESGVPNPAAALSWLAAAATKDYTGDFHISV